MPATALAHLSQFWGVRARIDEHGDLVGLSDPERVVHLMLCYTGEVGNGGHVQYFMNPGGAFAHETVEALNVLGAHEVANVLARTISLFPRGTVPKESRDRNSAVQQLSESAMAQLAVADQAVWQHSLDVLALSYLRQRSKDVLSLEQRD